MRIGLLALVLTLGCSEAGKHPDAELPAAEDGDAGEDESGGDDEEEAESSGGEASMQCFDRHEAPEMTYVDGDPRRDDADYEWTRTMLLEGSECVDCHRAPDSAKPPAEWIWDVGCEPVWTDSASDDDLVGFIARVLDPGEGRVDFTTEERERVAALVERELVTQVPALARLAYGLYDELFDALFSRAMIRPGPQRRLIEAACHWNLRRVRDPELRRRLTPDYQPMCKRIVMSWEYYEAMQRPNVKLVTEGIERVVPEGIVTVDGHTHPLDVLVLATGFRTHEYMRPLELINAQGLSLSSLWDERGPHAYNSLAIPQFPNFFLLGGPNSPLANGSVILYTEALVDYVMQCIDLYRRGALDTLAPTQAATDAFYDQLRHDMDGTVWVTGCQNWYIGKDGLPEVWPRRPREFNALLARPRLEDFEISRPTVETA